MIRYIKLIRYYLRYFIQCLKQPISHLSLEEIENEIDYFENITNINEESIDNIIWYERLKRTIK